MTDYSELVKALRSASTVSTAWEKLMHDAAAAIEALQAEEKSRKENCEKCSDATRRVITDLQGIIADLRSDLPKRGEWKPFDLTYGRSIYSCSVCEQATEVPMCMEKPMYAYCPNCGAKMTEVQE